MPRPIYHVDAFTARPFAGNPAAVCLLQREASEAWMQHVAAEMNLSETAFVRPLGEGFELRWFTPAAEVELCGHATLATAHLLWERNVRPTSKPLAFHTRHSGVLICRRGDDGWITMDFPLDEPEEAAPPAGLLEALRVESGKVTATARCRYDWLVEVAGAEVVRDLQPDFVRLAQFDMRGAVVTARADDAEHDFVSRFFAPRLRIHEDPVTGSIHCALAPWWSARLHKATLRAHQTSPRGGELRVAVRGDRVELAGQAVTIAAGEVLVDAGAELGSKFSAQ